jgi:hypothetical protein
MSPLAHTTQALASKALAGFVHVPLAHIGNVPVE